MYNPRPNLLGLLFEFFRSSPTLAPEHDPMSEAYQCANPACGCNSAKHDLPPVPDRSLVVMQGKPINEALEQVFSPWGKPKGIVADSKSILVQYEGNYQLRFIPITED